jgi:hypothetical protein
MKRATVVAVGTFILAACGESNGNLMNVDNLAVDNLVVNDVASVMPNYTEEEDGVYSYVAAVSEEDKKQGKAAGNVLRFAFRGIQDGNYVLSLVDDDGNPLSDSECSKPCRIIKTHVGDSVVRREYTPDSMIGAAFEDALNGRLKVKPERNSRALSNSQFDTLPEPSPAVSAAPTEVGSDEGYGDEITVNDVTAD